MCTYMKSSKPFLPSLGSMGLFNMTGEKWYPIMRGTWGGIIGCHCELSKLWKRITYNRLTASSNYISPKLKNFFETQLRIPCAKILNASFDQPTILIYKWKKNMIQVTLTNGSLKTWTQVTKVKHWLNFGHFQAVLITEF
jgi:hypothetical protein